MEFNQDISGGDVFLIFDAENAKKRFLKKM